MKCAFCGYEFDETQARSGCQGCPMHRSCGKLRCPNCGYEALPEPGLIKLIRRWGEKKMFDKGSSGALAAGSFAGAIPGARSLAEMAPGQSGKILSLNTRDQNQLRKLMAMGILPGVSVRLIQKHPAYVFQVGNTQIAVDRQIAQSMRVE